MSESGEADVGKGQVPSWENIELDELCYPYFYGTHKTHRLMQILLSKTQRQQ